MNHFHITFKTGKQMEFQAHNNDQAILRGLSWIKRWNHESARIERVNIMNPGQKILIGYVENEEYDRFAPSLLHDPEYLYKRPEKTKRKRRSSTAAKTADGQTKQTTQRSSFAIPLADLATELDVPATAIRRKLRSASIDKPEGGWGWDSREHATVTQIIEWFSK